MLSYCLVFRDKDASGGPIAPLCQRGDVTTGDPTTTTAGTTVTANTATTTNTSMTTTTSLYTPSISKAFSNLHGLVPGLLLEVFYSQQYR